MIRKKLMMSAIKKQTNLLSEMIREMEGCSPIDTNTYLFCYERTWLVEKNLRKLRKMSQNHRKDYNSFN